MTLKEKFNGKIVSFLNYKMKEQNVIECEKIADEFAIEFADWINDNCWNIEADRFLYEEEQYRYKELLEIFKKEKGL